MRKSVLVSIQILAITVFLTQFSQAIERIESPITRAHVDMIRTLFAENGLNEAQLKVDRFGRIELAGNYRDKKDVEVAFSLAQSVAGVRWVSPVTPENIRVKEWAKKLSGLFPTKPQQQLPPSAPKDSQSTTSNRFALLVGISKFNDSKINLKYAEKDAREFYSYLVDTRSANFKRENVYLLVNENATNKNMHGALDSIGNVATFDDEVIIYISSHGKPIYDGSMNIITYDTDTSSLPKAGLTSFWSEDLKDFIFKTKAHKIVVILDVCYSGQAFRGIKGFYNVGSNVDIDNDNQGISRTVMAKSLLGAKDIVFEDDVIKSTGTASINTTRVLISASDQGQRSWESDTLGSSFFTAYFIKGLKERPDVKQAFETARPQVIKHVRKEKNANQTPQVVTNKEKWGLAL